MSDSGALIEQLQAKGPALGRRAILEMYARPFWQARFGDRGRLMAEQDGLYHVTYLIQALAASDPAVLTGYARWLQTLLVSRGMCSRHIAENFERLQRAIEEDIPNCEPASGLLRQACEALLFDDGPGRELQLSAAPLAERVLELLDRRHPEWFARADDSAPGPARQGDGHEPRARCKQELLEHLSYLGDALGLARPELFAAHVVWARGFLARSSAPWARLELVLSALEDCLTPAEPAAWLPDGAGSAGGVPGAEAAQRTGNSRLPVTRGALALSVSLAVSARPVLHRARDELAVSARASSTRGVGAGSSADEVPP